MAHSSITQYLREVDEAIREKNGFTLAELISFKHPHVANPRLHIEHPEAQCQKWFEAPYDEMIAAHIRCTWAVSNHDFIEAYGCQALVAQAFTRAFQNQKEENWSLPVLFVVCLDLRLFANSADVILTKRGRGKPGEMLEKAADSIMGCFRVCASDNRSTQEESKKWGMLNLINQLFKIYFKLNKLHLCTPLIRVMDNMAMQERFGLAQVVTYRYYVGRKAIFDGDFTQAEEYLSFAFTRCHRSCKNNKRLILIYLLPVKMLLGHMPNINLLRKFDLMQFSDVAAAVSSGNLLQLDRALETHEIFFIKCGVYLILEKLRIITYRNLFKKVYLLMNTHQLPIDAFVTALKYMQLDDVDSDEVQCIIANLIYDNKIKGYISLQHQKLVVSKQNPFPSLASVTSS